MKLLHTNIDTVKLHDYCHFDLPSSVVTVVVEKRRKTFWLVLKTVAIS